MSKKRARQGKASIGRDWLGMGNKLPKPFINFKLFSEIEQSYIRNLKYKPFPPSKLNQKCKSFAELLDDLKKKKGGKK